MMQWIVFLVLGLIAGAIAKMIMPGRQGGGFLLTTGLGAVGSLLGGVIGRSLGIGGTSAGVAAGLSLPSLVTAIAGALVVLVIHRLVTGKK